ncbi:Rha family transcriptional regulator, partial [Thalassospira sp. MCCC 1A01428]|uniref:Rha family transcriptional regulator n=1 Tax=Thalassospira sp. MCCC 1A01428 TaxID=1470575 RepID=UPI00111BDF78
MSTALKAHNDNGGQPAVFNKHGQIMTNSRDVAAYFGKLHKNVLRDIDKLECDEDFYRLNYQPVIIEYENGKGGKQQARAFDMTKDGFWFLVTGFTGKPAALLKQAYIAQFNAMEQTLRTIPDELVRALGIVKTVVKKVTAI